MQGVDVSFSEFTDEALEALLDASVEQARATVVVSDEQVRSGIEWQDSIIQELLTRRRFRKYQEDKGTP
jgi:hypothetical protein